MQGNVMSIISVGDVGYVVPFPGRTCVLANPVLVLASASNLHAQTTDQAHDQAQISAIRLREASGAFLGASS